MTIIRRFQYPKIVLPNHKFTLLRKTDNFFFWISIIVYEELSSFYRILSNQMSKCIIRMKTMGKRTRWRRNGNGVSVELLTCTSDSRENTENGKAFKRIETVPLCDRIRTFSVCNEWDCDAKCTRMIAEPRI